MTLAYGELSLGRRFGKESKLSFHSTPTKGELRSRLAMYTYYLRMRAVRLVFSSCEALLYIERTRKKAKMVALKSNNGAPNPNIYEPLCKVIDYVIMNPAWRPTYVLVDRVIDFQSSDFSY